MAEVFISYSSVDSTKAEDILNRLEGAGICCWISNRDIAPGADYAVEIPKAITACKYFVLLLTNAAQDSPYVMLELDQAFKQKKEILPILLEEVQENEKTNFFLNAKQKEDGTKNLAVAVNKVIHRIKSGTSQPKNEASQREKNAQNHLKVIRCPHCEGEILKEKKDPRLGRGIEIEEGEITSRRHIGWGYRIPDRQILTIWVLAILLVLSIVIMLIPVFSNEKFLISSIILAVLAVLCTAFMIKLIFDIKEQYEYEIIDCEDAYNRVTKTMIQTISNSELRYWTLKCAKCEAEFSILLPKDETLDNRVATLLRDEKSESSFLQRKY